MYAHIQLCVYIYICTHRRTHTQRYCIYVHMQVPAELGPHFQDNDNQHSPSLPAEQTDSTLLCGLSKVSELQESSGELAWLRIYGGKGCTVMPCRGPEATRPQHLSACLSPPICSTARRNATNATKCMFITQTYNKLPFRQICSF